MDFWKILRILTTNDCNYQCIYCHNEGQAHAREQQLLPFESFLRVVKAIDDMGFQEIRISGGEPLINPDTIRMIEWLDANSDYEIGLATNGSLLSEDAAKRLGSTRTLVTMHLPSVTADAYRHITGAAIESLTRTVDLLDRYGVKHSFNYVLYPETIGNLTDVLDFVIRSGKRVKLLPYIEAGFHNYSNDVIKAATENLNKTAVSWDFDEKSGITSWIFENGAKVKLLHSPCYDHNFDRCREYGELRLLPDLSLQRCIFDKNAINISELPDDGIKRTITELWSTFSHCV